ncbi:hypothetical protein NF867_10850 [Solitalea sp. MAHUQ-68]|uniref:Thiamine pyrophosphokinase n=1 Tax=Solitalea agri TaxID=2953739 RepID=A0A9X2JCR7_9SPHI|nr:hypothetical protein [Solitalea agri]MCO4293363.1 hypothetical protein [Solitalea agri]
MSSHHIVREKQEPALIVSSYTDFNDEYLGQLLEWNPVVFVFENELENLLSKEIKIDAVFTTNSSETDPFQESTKTIILTSNSLNEAVKYLIEDEFPSVNIIAEQNELAGLVDCIPHIDIVLLNKNSKIFPVKSKLEKWFAANEQLTIINFNPENQYSMTGVRQIDKDVFETENNGIVTFSTTKSPIFVVEKLA